MVGRTFSIQSETCTACGHQHAGAEIGFICVGCPCEERSAPDALVIESDAPEAEEPTPAPKATPKAKRKKSTSPTQRTLAELRKRGWPAGVVEKFVRFPPPGHHVDLFGVLDVVAITTEVASMAHPLGEEPPRKGTGTLGIQACAGGDHGRRRAKILAESRARLWVEAGNRLELWSWSARGAKGKRKLWTLRVETYAEMVAGAAAEARAA